MNAGEAAQLLAIAGESIGRGFARREAPPWPSMHLPPALAAAGMSFVTVAVEGQPRGCCGTLLARGPLARDVWENAWDAAFRDPRFAPLTRSEYPRLELEVSVLSALEALPASSAAELARALRAGMDGLVLEFEGEQATFLPGVWKEHPGAREFIAALRRKAGWPTGRWSAGLRAWRFATERFVRGPSPAQPAAGDLSSPGG